MGKNLTNTILCCKHYTRNNLFVFLFFAFLIVQLPMTVSFGQHFFLNAQATTMKYHTQFKQQKEFLFWGSFPFI